MSAICCIWHRDGRPAAEDCSRMQRSLAIYGQDRGGLWHQDNIALGCQLAFLLPEDRFDRQPLVGGGGRFRLVADLRLDNRPELAAALAIPAERRDQMADADLLLAAWERWEAGCLDRLVGEFAFVLWDDHDRRLHLVRDMLGLRPLFYHRGDGFIAAATMAKGLHALPEIPRAADFERLRAHLALAPHRGSRSFFAGVERVEPGSLVTIDSDGQIRATQWYRWDFPALPRLRDPREYVEGMRSILDRAVADRLRATGPISSHLSGGYDSSLVTATAARLLADRGGRLTAYTHVPLQHEPLDQWPETFQNEWPLAAMVAAKHPNIEHVRVTAEHGAIGDDMDRTFHYFEFPVLNLCNQVWLTEICRLMNQRGQKVVLSGAFGNATVSQTGFERLADLFGRGRLVSWASESWALRRKQRNGWLWMLQMSLSPHLPSAWIHGLRTRLGRPRADLATVTALRAETLRKPSFQAELRDAGYSDMPMVFGNPRDLATFLLRRHDFTALVRKGQLAAYGVDEREPTTDRRLVEFALGLPPELLLRQGQPRWIYHQAFADRVPAEIRAERRRGYQSADWLTRLKRGKERLMAQVDRFAAYPAVNGLLDTEFMTNCLNSPLPEHPTGPGLTDQYRHKLLRAVSVTHFVGKVENRND